MATNQPNTFPDPLSVPTPEGCEGWEEMYPYYVLFSEDRAEYERSRFWFQNRYHLMDPMKPFEMVTPEFCYTAIPNPTTGSSSCHHPPAWSSASSTATDT